MALIVWKTKLQDTQTLIWVQTIFKGYQLMTLGVEELNFQTVSVAEFGLAYWFVCVHALCPSQ